MKFRLSSKSHSSFNFDLAANLTASAWSVLVQLLSVPLYIRFLGIEAYGLIGFYITLQAVLQVLDLGLSPTMNREMARYSVQPEKAEEARDLVRTLEVGYWLIGIVIGIVLVSASSWTATHWIKASAIPVGSVRHALALMGVVAALQWPVSFYQGGLIGLHKQVVFSALKVIASTISNVGAVLVLWLFSPTIEAFFLWLVAANAVTLVLWAFFLWKSLPPAARFPRFNRSLLRNIGRFAAGMGGITAAALILTQSDKLILSRLLSLKVFGYYTVGTLCGLGTSLIVLSVFNTFYPRFSALVAQGDEQALTQLYHRATQLMAVLILPVTAVIVLFSSEILLLWTRNSEVALNAGPIAAVLTIGVALNGLMNLPYALQLAYGWTSIGLGTTIFLIIIVVPALWFMTIRYGPIGAAFVFVGLQVLNMLIGLPLTHRRLLRHEMARWLFQDVAPPLAASVLVAGIARTLITHTMSPFATLATLLLVLFTTLDAAALSASEVRRPILAKLGVRKSSSTLVVEK